MRSIEKYVFIKGFCVLLSGLFVSVLAHAGPPDILLAHVYQSGIPINAYLVSEKLDGVRAVWDG